MTSAAEEVEVEAGVVLTAVSLDTWRESVVSAVAVVDRVVVVVEGRVLIVVAWGISRGSVQAVAAAAAVGLEEEEAVVAVMGGLEVVAVAVMGGLEVAAVEVEVEVIASIVGSKGTLLENVPTVQVLDN